MKTRKMWSVSLLLLAAPLSFSSHSDAGVVGFPAQEVTQILNYGLLGQQLTQDVQQVQQVFQQLQWMIYNSQDLPQHVFTSIVQDLNQLANVVNQSQGLAYGMGNLNAQFQQQFPAYQPGTNWIPQYATWNANLLKTIMGTLASAGLQGQQLNSEQAVMSQLRLMASTPGVAQDQAIQLGNTISQEVASELAKLRQLQITDLQEKSAYTGYLVQNDAAKQQANANATATASYTGDGRVW